MNNLVKEWKLAADDLKLEIVSPFEIKLDETHTLQADVLVKNFGAEKGMLIFLDVDVYWPHRDKLIDTGYGFTSYSEPSENKTYNRENFIEMLSDWGWNGDQKSLPSWVITPQSDE